MKRQTAIVAIFACAATVAAASALRPFRQYTNAEGYNLELPKGFNEKTEWVFARLMYPAVPISWRAFENWKEGGEANWTIDYPKSDRALSLSVQRLTRLHARSVEQPVSLDDDDDVFNYPWLYAVEVGYWNLTDAQIAKFREYLLRGGFFMCDDFHGDQQWEIFTSVMKRVFPDRQIVDVPREDQIFHVVHNLDDKYQVPGAQFLESHNRAEFGGTVPHWRGIYDDKGRLMVAICHNMDLGDSWEHADDPEYPSEFSALGLRIGVNYVVYALTH